MNRSLLSIIVYFLTFAFGILASELALPVYAELALHPLLRGLFAGVLTLSTAIFLLSGAIRVICGNRPALDISTHNTLGENRHQELREVNR